MRFTGLDPWPQAVPLIEIESEGSTFDLHNWGEFLGFSFETPDSLSLRFRHWRRGASTSASAISSSSSAPRRSSSTEPVRRKFR